MAKIEGVLLGGIPDATLADLVGQVRAAAKLFELREELSAEIVPKGLLVMGVSGCGKSLAVKVIADQWKLPLFRLDMNLVFAGVQGSGQAGTGRVDGDLAITFGLAVWFERAT